MVKFMSGGQTKTLEDIRRFMEGAMEVKFSIEDKAERHRWIQCTLMRERWFDSLIMKVTIRKLEYGDSHDHD